MSSARAVATLLLFVAASAGDGSAHARARKAKRRPRAPTGAQAVLGAAVDERREAVQGCVFQQAVRRGALRVEVEAHVTVNHAGQVMRCQVAVNAGPVDGESTRACIEADLRAVRWPRIDAPLAEIDRTWSFAVR